MTSDPGTITAEEVVVMVVRVSSWPTRAGAGAGGAGTARERRGGAGTVSAVASASATGRRDAGAPALLVALRSADPQVVEVVADVVERLEGRLVVRPPGTAAVPAHVHVDAVAESPPDAPSWGPAAIVVARSRDAAPVRQGPAVVLPAEAGALADAITLAAVGHGSRVIGVVGARGGVGASVTAALLARVAAEHRATTLVDLAGGLEVVLGTQDRTGLRWADLTEDVGPFPAETLVEHLPRWGRVPVLAIDRRGAPEPPVVPVVLASLRRANDVLVIDLPRAPVQALVRECDEVLVVTGQDAGSAAGVAALQQRGLGVPLSLVARREPGPVVVPAEELASWCGLPLLGRLPHAPTLRGDLARGLTPGDRRRSALARAARSIATRTGLT